MGNLSTRGIVITGLLLILALTGCLVLEVVFYRNVEIGFSIVIVLCVCILLMMLLLAAFGFNALHLGDSRQAFGLPDGSIRALLAILLVVIWVIVSLFLVAFISGFYGNHFMPSPDGIKIGEQLYTTMSTLVVAISAFFFGSNTHEGAQRSATQTAQTRPVITLVAPGNGIQGDSIRSFTIVGKHLGTPKSVQLTYKHVQKEVEYLSSTHADISIIKCSLEIGRDWEPGKWDVTVTDYDGHDYVLPHAFEVIKREDAVVSH